MIKRHTTVMDVLALKVKGSRTGITADQTTAFLASVAAIPIVASAGSPVIGMKILSIFPLLFGDILE